jgi:hypothetical protein
VAAAKLIGFQREVGFEASWGPNSSGMSVPAQLVIYEGGTPAILEGTAHWAPDGSLQVDVTITRPPAVGTPIQVIIYGPGRPTVYEGTSGAVQSDGSFEIRARS